MSSVQLKSTFTSIGSLDVSIPPSSLLLKLTVSEKAIRYYIQTLTHDQIILFGKYSLHHVENSEDLSERLEKIVEKDEALQLAFAKVAVGSDAEYQLAPYGLTDVESGMLSQSVPDLGLEILFKMDEQVKYKINGLFRNVSLVHLNSSLLRLLPSYLDRGTTDKLFINVEQGIMDIIRFTPTKQLQLMNRYEYRHENDFIYYLLLCCEDMEIDREQVELVLLGEVDMQSQIYSMCYRYFKQLGFITQPPGISFTRAFDLYPKHLNFNLYNLTA